MNTDLLLFAATRQINPNQARIVTYFELLGPFGIHVVGTAFIAFVFTVLILWRGRGNFAAAALVLVVFSPLMVGMFAGLHLASRSLLDISQFCLESKGAEVQIKPIEHYMLALDMISPISTALFLSAPTYLLAMIGACVKAWGGRGEVTAVSQ
jgi:hypothetical protein